MLKLLEQKGTLWNTKAWKISKIVNRTKDEVTEYFILLSLLQNDIILKKGEDYIMTIDSEEIVQQIQPFQSGRHLSTLKCRCKVSQSDRIRKW